jgi:hypothetical protein
VGRSSAPPRLRLRRDAVCGQCGDQLVDFIFEEGVRSAPEWNCLEAQNPGAGHELGVIARNKIRSKLAFA